MKPAKPINVGTLHIMLDLNSSVKADANVDAKAPADAATGIPVPTAKPKSVMFKYDMLDIPDLAKLPDQPTITSQLPLFTNSARYSTSKLGGMTQNQILEFFFNEQTFKTLMQTSIGTQWVDLEKDKTDLVANSKLRRANEKHNVMTMLEYILPIHPKINQVLQSSYDNILQNRNNANVWWGVDVAEAVNVFGVLEKTGVISSDRGVYLKIGGKPKAIAGLTWTNDLVYHPEYNEFIRTFCSTSQSVGLSKFGAQTVLVETKGPELENKIKDMLTADEAKDLLISEIPVGNITPLLNDRDKARLNNSTQSKYTALKKLSDADIKKLIKQVVDAAAVNAANAAPNPAVKNAEVKTADEYLKIWKNDQTIHSFAYNLETLANTESYSSSDIEKAQIRKAATNAIVRQLMSMTPGMNAIEYAKGIQNIIISIEESKNTVGYMDQNVMFNGKDQHGKDQLKDLAIAVLAANAVLNFSNTSIVMNLGPSRIDKTEKTSFEKQVDAKITKDFPDAAKDNQRLDKALQLVYLARRTSNTALYDLIEKTKKGQGNDGKFDAVYNKYIEGYPLDVSMKDIKEFMYTGVDTISANSDNQSTASAKDSSASTADNLGKQLQIYVRMDVIAKSNLLKNPKASCIQKDDDLANMAKYLWTNKSIDVPDFMNRYRKFAMFDEIDPALLLPPPQPPANIKPKANPTKGGTRRRRRNRLHRKLSRRRRNT